MNKRMIELAEEAGFCFWEDEEWKPHGAMIDWSADYDDEFQKYTELLIRRCAEIALREEHYPYSYILNHFGIEE